MSADPALDELRRLNERVGALERVASEAALVARHGVSGYGMRELREALDALATSAPILRRHRGVHEGDEPCLIGEEHEGRCQYVAPMTKEDER